ncbi:uncharacterized protein BO97DRAFT_479452 [Aspergillus homomorphus CBS 101889]|uniref:F-box domain-containing protein n=1 Tax=Aspergillus homomorphus (strain CBS 101889) TaxID=1450537 RepID=A0A395HR21_ASPHC|nr:hypothetical protein BO97DRAFT_479452 [Aspergillus homomorphus CBS 101889]RAL10200.1 hypothetical protein BO97DRAFT_479452 [Aspergillus homomorphus CBS 101889]
MPSSNDPFLRLPPELLVCIMTYLPSFEDIGRVAQASVHMNKVWHANVLTIFRVIGPTALGSAHPPHQLLTDQNGAQDLIPNPIDAEAVGLMTTLCSDFASTRRYAPGPPLARKVASLTAPPPNVVYQAWSLNLVDREERKSRYESMSLQALCAGADVLSSFQGILANLLQCTNVIIFAHCPVGSSISSSASEVNAAVKDRFLRVHREMVQRWHLREPKFVYKLQIQFWELRETWKGKSQVTFRELVTQGQYYAGEGMPNPATRERLWEDEDV